jgi:glyoxylase-like metal-dependent hydrolase (beta-lactamase superfamily II)
MKALFINGDFRVSVHDHGSYRLDGGAMFGTVPKTLWAKEIPADAENRIKLATRSLVIESEGRTFLVDAGNGDKGTDKFKAIFDIRNTPLSASGFDPGAVTDLVLTHLHFDHAGGATRYAPAGPPDLESRYPEATIYVQAANFENAKAPNAREKASYLKENVFPLESGKLHLTDGSEEIFPGIWVHRSDGHTRGLQWLEVRAGAETFAFPSDLIPTARHIPLAYTMGYDICAEALLAEKEDLLRRAVQGNWIVVFVHDPDIPAARVKIDEKGRFVLGDVVVPRVF